MSILRRRKTIARTTFSVHEVLQALVKQYPNRWLDAGFHQDPDGVARNIFAEINSDGDMTLTQKEPS